MKEFDLLKEELYFQVVQLEKIISADLLRRELVDAWRKREEYLDPEDKADVFVDGSKIVILSKEGFKKLAQAYLEEKGNNGFSSQFYLPIVKEAIENVAKEFNPSFFLTAEKAEDIFKEYETLSDFKEDHLDRKQSRFRRIFKDIEGKLRKPVVFGAIAASIVALGAGYFFVYKPHEEFEHKLNLLRAQGLTESEAKEFLSVSTYKNQPLDPDGITFAKMWIENKEIANYLHQLGGSFSKAVHGDPDDDLVESAKEMLVLGTHPTRTNYIIKHAIKKGFGFDIIKEIAPLEKENESLVSEEIKKEFIDKLFELDENLRRDFVIEAMKKKTLIPVDYGRPPRAERKWIEITDIEGAIDQIKFLSYLKKSDRNVYDNLIRSGMWHNYDLDADGMNNLFELLNSEENGGLYNPFVTNERYFVFISGPYYYRFVELTDVHNNLTLLKVPSKNVIIIGYENLFKKDIYNAISEITKKANENDFIFLHLSGVHADIGTGKYGALIRAPGEDVRRQDSRFLGTDVYTFDVVRKYLDNTKAKAVVVAVDLCESARGIPYLKGPRTIVLTNSDENHPGSLDLAVYLYRALVGSKYEPGYIPPRKYISIKDAFKFSEGILNSRSYRPNPQIYDPENLAEKVFFGDYKSSVIKK